MSVEPVELPYWLVTEYRSRGGHVFKRLAEKRSITVAAELPIEPGSVAVLSLTVTLRGRRLETSAKVPLDLDEGAIPVVTVGITFEPTRFEEIEVRRDDEGAMTSLVKAVY